MESPDVRAEIERLKAHVAALQELIRVYEEPSSRTARSSEQAAPASALREDVLQLIAAGTASATGVEFFRSLVFHLALALRVRCASVGVLAGPRQDRLRTLAIWLNDEWAPNQEYALAGTPCAEVLTRGGQFYADGIRRRFPGDAFLSMHGLESYCGTPLRDRTGRILGVLDVLHAHPVGSITEIGSILSICAARTVAELERTEAEAAQRSSDQRLRALLDTEPDCVKILDLEGRVVEMNPAGLSLLEAERPEQVVGRLASDFVAPEYRESFETGLRQALEGGAGVCEFEILGLKGSRRWLQTSVVPLRDGADRVTHALAITRDMSGHIRGEQALRESEQRFRSLVQQARDVIFTLGVDGRLLSLNPAFEALTGWRCEEWIARPYHELLEPDGVVVAQALFERVVQGESLGPFMLHFRTSDARRLVGELTVTPEWKDGAVVAVHGVARDVTARVQAEAQVQASEARHRALIEHSYDLICEVSEEARFRYVSPNYLETLGYLPEDLVGRGIFELVHPEDLPAVLQEFHKEKGTAMFRYRHRNGAWRWFEGTGKWFLDAAGNKVAVVISRDITYRKRADEALQAEKERYRMLVEQAADGIFISDSEGNYLEVNSQACRMLGYTREEILHVNVRDLVPAEDQATDPVDLEALRDGAIVRRERRLMRKDGSVLLVELSAKMLPDGRVQAFVRDVTERRRREEEQRRLAAILQATTDFVGTADRDEGTLFVNRAGRKLIGIGEEENLSGVPIAQYHPEWAMELIRREGMPAAIRDGVWVGETALRARSGEEIPVSQVILSHKSPAGDLLYFSTILRDLRERKRLEDHLRQAAKMEAVGRLAGGIAHDFNNLLTVINGHSDLLFRRLDARDQLRRHAEEIKKAGDRAASLTQQLLTFSRRQMGEPRTVDLNAVVSDTTGMLRRLLGENIHLQTRLASDPQPVTVDPGQLEQVIVNLAVNARDAMPAGGTLRISTCTVEGGSHAMVRLLVEDTGCGMKDDVVAHVFEPFYTTKEVGKGTGLGLAVVYGIVQQHKGVISVKSTPGCGTVFTIDLPRSEGLLPKVLPALKPAQSGARGETILLVEDEPILRTFIREMLAGVGYRVLEAGSGDEALQLLSQRSERVHLLLTDVIMPGMTGPQLAERLRGQAATLPVLLISGYAEESVLPDGMKGAPWGFLRKPFAPDALAQKIRELLDAAGESGQA